MVSGDTYFKCKTIAIRTGILPKDRVVYETRSEFKDHKSGTVYIDALLEEISTVVTA